MTHDLMRFTSHTLASGLRVFFQHRPLPFAGCALMVHAGSRHDPEGKEELMHLLEHLLSAGGTEGAPRLSLVELDRWLKAQRLDVTLGETHLDFSAYRGKASLSRFPALLSYLRDLTLRPLLDSNLEKERDIIRREREEAASPEERETDDRRRAAVYGDHRLARVNGWADDATLDALTLDDAREAHSRCYDPANMTLVVVGGTDEDGLLRTIEETFPSGRPGYAPLPRQDPPTLAVPSPREHRQAKEGRVTNMETRYIWHLPAGPRAPLILARNGLQETLTERIRERLRATYSVNVHDHSYADHRVFAISTECAQKKVELARTIIEETMRDASGLAAEVPRLKEEYGLAVEFIELDVEETVERCMAAINVAGAPRPMSEVLAAIEAATPEDVATLLEERLSPDRAYVELVEK